MIQSTDKRTVIYQMSNDELFNVDGDLATMCEFLSVGRKHSLSYNREEIKAHLLSVSTNFVKNPEQDKVIDSALKLLKELKVIQDA